MGQDDLQAIVRHTREGAKRVCTSAGVQETSPGKRCFIQAWPVSQDWTKWLLAVCSVSLLWLLESGSRADKARLGSGHLWQQEVIAAQVVMGSRGQPGQSSASRPMALCRWASLEMSFREISPQGRHGQLHGTESRCQVYLSSSC